jgi:hypothetical protein
VWLQSTVRPWLIIAILAACTALAAFVADRLVETDREYIEALFPRLAVAERQDIDTILASLDPELWPLRDDAESEIKEVKPSLPVFVSRRFRSRTRLSPMNCTPVRLGGRMPRRVRLAA